jgi:hypothetical protein
MSIRNEMQAALVRDLLKIRGIKAVTIYEPEGAREVTILLKLSWLSKRFKFVLKRIAEKVRKVEDKSPYIQMTLSEPNPKDIYVMPL